MRRPPVLVLSLVLSVSEVSAPVLWVPVLWVPVRVLGMGAMAGAQRLPEAADPTTWLFCTFLGMGRTTLGREACTPC